MKKVLHHFYALLCSQDRASSYVSLEILLKKHSKWPKLKSIIVNGADYPKEPISEEDRLKDIKFHLQRGNHKSATSNDGLLNLNKAYDKEIKFGWQIPLLLHPLSS